ncbi:hypothetical protein [Rhizobium sp. SG570]|uniref:hypothetical protein n=1 Tax=Rhizobium sp. SG570 TaxID=2587113 RepID=UPI001446DD51|nr:hypothetical protein [Rhizobium sp. SG570]NKJ40312.1 hypothetical protein [Rhizobium sp. SG570]
MRRFLYLALMAWVSVFLFLKANDVLLQLLPTSDVRRLGRAVELATLYRQSLTERAEALDASSWIDPRVLADVAESPSMRAAGNSCLDEVSRGALAIRLGALDQAVLSEASDRDIRNLLAAADQAVKRRLQCTPTDGNAWLLRAQILVQQGGDMTALSRSLDLSYFYAPAEKWIMIPRLRLVSNLIDSGRTSLPPQYGLDLERVIRLSEPSEIATLYVESGEKSRQLMRTMIDQQRLDRRVRILRTIDALGISYPVAAACQTPVFNGPPGAELELRRPADLVAACAK